MQKYQLPESEGVLVVYGSGRARVHDFIKMQRSVRDEHARRERPRFVFKGENALLNSLTFLARGQERRPWSISRRATASWTSRSAQAKRIDVGIGLLIEELNRVNYQTRELTVAADTDKVPDDADIVVVARPREEVPAKFVKALRDYCTGTNRKDKKKGKLIVLFDVVQRGGKGPMVRTGLETLVAEHGVRVNDNRVLDLVRTASRWRSRRCQSAVARTRSLKAFANESEGTVAVSVLQGADGEAPRPNPPGAAGGRHAGNPADDLPEAASSAETDLEASPSALLQELHAQRAGEDQREAAAARRCRWP